jgi:hypothetical protein
MWWRHRDETRAGDIQQLTAEQKARLPEFVDRWTKIGLCTDPADRPRAEAAIRDMYRQVGLEPPRAIVWCGSPLSQGLTCVILRFGVPADVRKSVVRGSVWANVLRDSLRLAQRRRWRIGRFSVRGDFSLRARVYDGAKAVGASVMGSVSDSVRRSVYGTRFDSILGSVEDVKLIVGDSVRFSGCYSVTDSVWNSVRESVADSVRDSVSESVAASVRNHVGASVWDSVRNHVGGTAWESVGGAHDAYWLAADRYFSEVAGLVDQTSKVSGLWELAQSAGWALPLRNICWVSERHHLLKWDDRGRLHSLAGPACAYPDGWAIYAVHGVLVPAYIVERPEQISVQRIDGERNAEVRRVMIERYRHGEEISGGAAYMRDAGGERLDHDARFGTLWRRNVPGDEPIVMVEVVNATAEPDGRRKRYWLRVPPEMTSARQAVAWTFDAPPEDYAPAIET